MNMLIILHFRSEAVNAQYFHIYDRLLTTVSRYLKSLFIAMELS